MLSSMTLLAVRFLSGKLKIFAFCLKIVLFEGYSQYLGFWIAPLDRLRCYLPWFFLILIWKFEYDRTFVSKLPFLRVSQLFGVWFALLDRSRLGGSELLTLYGCNFRLLHGWRWNDTFASHSFVTCFFPLVCTSFIMYMSTFTWVKSEGQPGDAPSMEGAFLLWIVV
jgi:hypothetical protein